jgi:hypothetical protein
LLEVGVLINACKIIGQLQHDASVSFPAPRLELRGPTE